MVYLVGKKKINIEIDYGSDIEKEVQNLSKFIEDKIPKLYPTRWFAVKLLEGGLEILNFVKSLLEVKKLKRK